VYNHLHHSVTKRIFSFIFSVGGALSFLGCDSNLEFHPGICISFDDRTIHEWNELSPLFDRYGAKVTFFVTQFDSLDEEEIAILKKLKAKGHEIGSHGAMHVISEHYIQEHGYRKYLENEIDQGVSSMEKQGLKPTSFAYPYGAKYWFTDYLLLKRFKVIRDVAVMPEDDALKQLDDIFISDRDDNVSALGFDYGSKLTIDNIKPGIERAIRQKEILMLYGHYPGSDTTDNYTFDKNLLEEILKLARERGLRFYCVSELADV
jgi:peptidoglycan/xylan/chitin deacetylase (PgdA/CDA1 family)